jgi:hypothetical protein
MDAASLWLDIDAPAIASPVVSREQALPFIGLTWENFERLCYRLAHRGGNVEDTRIYGDRGQAQDGIDLYVRRATGDYATWQCKRYREMTATELEKAVTKFLEGDWAKRTKLFRLAVAANLNSTELVDEIEKQRARCAAEGITFEPLDQSRLSTMLKDHADLVDDFFGRSWVEAFNGAEAATALSGRRLSREQKLSARRFVQALYSTHFQTVDGGIPAAAPVFRGAVRRVPVFKRYVEPSVELVESTVEHVHASNSETGSSAAAAAGADAGVGFHRREIRTTLGLAAAMATSDRFLLLGGAGFGKSAALRVIIHSLLSDEARFPAIAKAWGQRLPLLLPFGFLTRHFAENGAATIESALNGWLKVLGAKQDVLALLEEMVTDDRLLLLVDGLDEWQNREAAVAALTALTAYTQTRRLPLIATGRPLGFERISDFGPEWKRAKLLPLNPIQQLELATYWFRHFHEAEGLLDSAALGQAVARDASGFANELSEDPALLELGGVPLLLSVMIYLRLSGRVLPHSRLAALEELVKALLEDQPRRRAQAAMQRVDQSAARSPRIRRGIEYLAFCIHQGPNSLVLTNERAAHLLREYFRVDLELPPSEAEEWAARVLDLGQHEFGVLVTPQEEHVGLLHRIFQEYLAARYLSRLSLDRVKAYCAETGRDGPWHEVTLTLMQLLDRQDDVDGLIEELRKPVADCLEEPGQKILLARLAVAGINCSRNKACELVSQVFTWIECGRWMPLRLSLVRELAAGFESEQVGALVAARAGRWFPGRLRWLHDVPAAATKMPTTETVSDLRIALHNCDSSYDYRGIAEALAKFSVTVPGLADEFLSILRESAEPELLAAALHALALGWPAHPALGELLSAASAAPSKDLRYVAILARFNQGERSDAIRVALVGFCREGDWMWPWEKEIIGALVTGWPRDSQLKRDALERIEGIQRPRSWAPMPAVDYLLRGWPGDDDVARMVASQMFQEDHRFRMLNVADAHESLLAGFTKHPLLVAAAESWLEKNAATSYSPLEVAVIAKIGGTPKCRQALLDWLRRGASMPAWIISTLLEMGPLDPELQAVLTEYIGDDRRRADAVRWLPAIVRDPKELGVMLREVLRGEGILNSLSAITLLVGIEGRDGLWSEVEAKLTNDKQGHYWRLGHRTLVNIWPQQPLIRELVKRTVFAEDISLSVLLDAYGGDPEIRPLLDQTMRVLHEDLRIEFIRAVDPLAHRGVPAAVAIVAEFRDEPNGEARTVAARAYSRACLRIGRQVAGLEAALVDDLTGFGMGQEQRRQAAVVGLLELNRPDLIVAQREYDRPLHLSTDSNSHHNWEFVACVVDHWEALVAAAPDIWERFDHSPILATELAKAGKGDQAFGQTVIFENAVRTGRQLDVAQVRALIALHGSSALLRDLFMARLQHFRPGREQSMMVVERAAYQAMGFYLADYFHGDPTVRESILEVAASPLINDVGLVSLCRGWPDSPQIAAAAARLPDLIDADEPVTAWLFSTKADAELMAAYLLRYPKKLMRSHFGEAREGVAAVRGRLQSDRKCREIVFTELKRVTDPDTMVGLAKLLAPSMRQDDNFRAWVSALISANRAKNVVLGPLAFDVLSNACKPVAFSLQEAVLTRT